MEPPSGFAPGITISTVNMARALTLLSAKLQIGFTGSQNPVII